MNPSAEHGNITIFLVDDDQDHLQLTMKALAGQGEDLVIKTFTSWSEALRAMEGWSPDVVISDYTFPGEADGLTFLREVRRRGWNIPFIFLTGQGSEEVAAEALRLGAEDYFTKDAGFSHFVKIGQAVRRAADHQRMLNEKEALGEKAAKSESFCEQLMNEANDAIVVLSEEGVILNVNKKGLEESGYAIEELRGIHICDVIPGGDQGQVAEIFHLLIDQRQPVKGTIPARRGDGAHRILDFSAKLVPSPHGKGQILAIVRDVTESKEQEQLLVWNRQLMDEIINSLEETIHVVDRDLKVLFCSRNISRLSRGKISPEEIVGRPLVDIFPFLRVSGALEEYRRVFEEGKPLESREVTRYHGRIIATKTIKVPIKDRGGLVEKVVTIMRDVTQEHLALEERALLTRAVDEASVGVAITDRSGIFMYVNRCLAALLGYASPEEIVGRGWRHLVPGTKVETYAAGLKCILEHPGRWNGEAVLLRKDQTSMSVYTSVMKLQGDDDARYVLVIQDMAREKSMLDEIARKNRELEAMTQEVNTFISMTSHELRSPLTNIEGFAHLLSDRLETLSTPEIKEFVERIAGNADRLHHLIEDLFLFARERKRAVEHTEVNLKSLLEDVVEQLAKAVEASAARISLCLEADAVRADRQKLFQVLKNLLENALIYRREGIPPEISVAALPAEGGGVLFRVSDNGPGVLETEKDMIFEIFRRGSASRGKPGTGVGLALVKENVSQMGGIIRVESEPGRGAAFSFRLPPR